MKKFLSLILASCLCFALALFFVSCDSEEEASGGKEATGISAEEWEAMLAEANFDNYTLTENQKVTYENVTMQQDAVFKVAGDKASVDLKVDGQQMDILYYAGEEAAMQKQAYEQIYRALLAEYDHYAYDKDTQFYVLKNEVTVEIPMDLYDASISIVMKDAKVKLSEDGKVLNFECNFTQATTTQGQTIMASAEAVWTFSDYGTTVVEEAAE